MVDAPLPFPSEAELLAAYGYPFLPLRVRYRPVPSWHPLADGVEAARYLYTGAGGEPRCECIRFHTPPGHPAAPDKAFLWRRVDADGEWAWGLEGVDTVPYRLPRVRAAVAAGERVYVVEGEKDVHALEALGLNATTNPLGALQWTPAHAEALRGADVVVIPDNDRVGWVHAARVMATLRGLARSAALLLLPVGPREDVSDWLSRGNGAAELGALADAAPRDPSPAELAALLELPPGVDPLTTDLGELHALLKGAAPGAGAAPAPHPGFRRSAAAFARLGVVVRPAAPPPGVPEAHSTWRAIAAAVQAADASAAPLLDDASLLDRASYELGLFAGLLRAALAGEPPAPSADGDAAEAALTMAPTVRLVRTRWGWEEFLADPALREPPEPGTAWALHLSPSGPLQVRRLHPLPALLLEACESRPLTRHEAAAVVAERVEGDPARIAAMVGAQVDELLAAGLLRPAAADVADQAVDEMRRLLLGDEPPQAGARSVVGMLSRAVRATREHANAALGAGDDPYPLHRLDLAVNGMEQLLSGARLRDAFSTELEGYWAGDHAATRVRSLAPLLDVLGRALGSGAHALPPFILTA